MTRWMAAFYLRFAAFPLDPVGGNHGYPYTTGRYGFEPKVFRRRPTQ